MQKPFPALTDLDLEFDDRTAPTVPDSLLGGSAPGLDLRSLWLESIPFPFPGLRKLLSTATDLVEVRSPLENSIFRVYFT